MTIAIIIFIILLISLGFFYYKNKKTQACFENICFDLELATTTDELKTGLMYRKNLEENKGMLFIFNTEGYHSFWMKNTLIPLDIIWINNEDKVVYVAENAQPCENDSCQSIKPSEKAKYVLEITGGLSSKFNITVGDKVKLKY